MSFDVNIVRKDFPILSQKMQDGKPLVYLDNSATAQKPQCVIDAIAGFYLNYNSNIHRSSHTLSRLATEAYEDARKTAAEFLNADEAVFTPVFTRGATESLNLIAQSLGRTVLQEGDEILLTQMEHHANIVPWQMIAAERNAKIIPVKITEDGALDLEDFEKRLNEKTKIVSFTHASNVLGTVNDAAGLCRLIRKHSGAKISIDAAQSAPHRLPDLAKIDCDFLSLSGHKCYGPTGIGVLLGRTALLNAMPPYQGGGDMIDSVSWQRTTFRAAPERFEAGTPDIAGAIGLAAAFKYMASLDWDGVKAHEEALLERLEARLGEISGLKIYGRVKGKLPIAAFSCEGAHPHDIATLLNASGIAVRTGHHCAEPLHATLGVPSTCRASFAFYNTFEELDFFADKLGKALEVVR